MGAALLLIIAAAFAHAGWNFFAKRAGAAGSGFVWLTATCSAVLYLPVMVGAIITSGIPPWQAWLLGVATSAGVHLGYFLVLQRGYALGDMSIVYPVARGTGPLLAIVAAIVLLGERPGVLGLLGGLLVVAGVFVIGFSGGLSHSRARRTSAAFGVLTGLLIAVYTLWDAHVVTTLGLSPLVYEWSSHTLRSVLMLPYVLTRPAHIASLWKTYRRHVLAVALLSPLAYLLVLFAMQLAPVSLVAPARELSIVLAGIMAWRLLGEPQPARRLTGAMIVLAGVVVLGLA